MNPKFSNCNKLPFMKAFFRGEDGQLFPIGLISLSFSLRAFQVKSSQVKSSQVEAVFPPPPSSLRWHFPYAPSPPGFSSHVAKGLCSLEGSRLTCSGNGVASTRCGCNCNRYKTNFFSSPTL